MLLVAIGVCARAARWVVGADVGGFTGSKPRGRRHRLDTVAPPERPDEGAGAALRGRGKGADAKRRRGATQGRARNTSFRRAPGRSGRVGLGRYKAHAPEPRDGRSPAESLPGGRQSGVDCVSAAPLSVDCRRRRLGADTGGCATTALAGVVDPQRRTTPRDGRHAARVCDRVVAPRRTRLRGSGSLCIGRDVGLRFPPRTGHTRRLGAVSLPASRRPQGTWRRFAAGNTGLAQRGPRRPPTAGGRCL